MPKPDTIEAPDVKEARLVSNLREVFTPEETSIAIITLCREFKRIEALKLESSLTKVALNSINHLITKFFAITLDCQKKELVTHLKETLNMEFVFIDSVALVKKSDAILNSLGVKTK